MAFKFEASKPDPVDDLVSKTEKLSTSDEAKVKPDQPKIDEHAESPGDVDEKDQRKEKVKDTKPAEPSPKTKTPRDPIRWFGILVPPSLRSAQGSFISAVEGPVPQLASLTSELRKQEIDIGRLRKQIRKARDDLH